MLTRSQCKFTGALDVKEWREMGWIIADDESYVHPCGDHQGLTLDCEEYSPCRVKLADGTSYTRLVEDFQAKRVGEPDPVDDSGLGRD